MTDDETELAWRKASAGHVTASRISDVMAKGKGGKPSLTRARYARELVAERLTGLRLNGYQSDAMKRGNDLELEARALYEARFDVDVEKPIFIKHPTIEWSGASPDGLIGEDGGVEFKCPLVHTHIETMLTKHIPLEYIYQIQWCMECTNRQWWDYISYCPDLPYAQAFYLARLTRGKEMIDIIAQEVIAFLADVDMLMNKLRCPAL